MTSQHNFYVINIKITPWYSHICICLLIYPLIYRHNRLAGLEPAHINKPKTWVQIKHFGGSSWDRTKFFCSSDRREHQLHQRPIGCSRRIRTFFFPRTIWLPPEVSNLHPSDSKSDILPVKLWGKTLCIFLCLRPVSFLTFSTHVL